MNKATTKRYLKAQERMEYIREFAKNMGYTVFEANYEHCDNNRPCHSIELDGTADSEGNPYAWAWYTDTWEEF